MISRLIRLGTAVAIVLLFMGKIEITPSDISMIIETLRTTAEQMPGKTEQILRTEPTDVLPALIKLGERIIFSTNTDVAAPLSSEAQPTTTHIVKRGNTLYSIAKRYDVTVDAIRQANDMTSNDLSVGQQLCIP